MTRIAVTVGIAWGLAALVVWAWIRAATRPVPATYREPDDGVQPWDIPTTWTFAAGPSFTVTTDDQSETTGRPN
jgi:HAMP domain-containing protein